MSEQQKGKQIGSSQKAHRTLGARNLSQVDLALVEAKSDKFVELFANKQLWSVYSTNMKSIGHICNTSTFTVSLGVLTVPLFHQVC